MRVCFWVCGAGGRLWDLIKSGDSVAWRRIAARERERVQCVRGTRIWTAYECCVVWVCASRHIIAFFSEGGICCSFVSPVRKQISGHISNDTPSDTYTLYRPPFRHPIDRIKQIFIIYDTCHATFRYTILLNGIECNCDTQLCAKLNCAAWSQLGHMLSNVHLCLSVRFQLNDIHIVCI